MHCKKSYPGIALLCAAGEMKLKKKNLRCFNKNLINSGSKCLSMVTVQELKQGGQKG